MQTGRKFHFPPGIFMSRKDFQSLLVSGISSSEIKIICYLVDMCNEWAFTTEDSKSIAAFFSQDESNIRKRIANLKKLEILKTVEYNGRSGFMINPRYCYQGRKRITEFRCKLWEEEKIYTKNRPRYFYGPPLVSSDELMSNAVNHPWYGRKGYRRRRFIHQGTFTQG